MNTDSARSSDEIQPVQHDLGQFYKSIDPAVRERHELMTKLGIRAWQHPLEFDALCKLLPAEISYVLELGTCQGGWAFWLAGLLPGPANFCLIDNSDLCLTVSIGFGSEYEVCEYVRPVNGQAILIDYLKPSWQASPNTLWAHRFFTCADVSIANSVHSSFKQNVKSELMLAFGIRILLASVLREADPLRRASRFLHPVANLISLNQPEVRFDSLEMEEERSCARLVRKAGLHKREGRPVSRRLLGPPEGFPTIPLYKDVARVPMFQPLSRMVEVSPQLA